MKSPSTASMELYKFFCTPAPLRAVRPRGRILFSPRRMRRSRVSPQFSTETFCRVTLVENSGAKNSRGESRFPPGCEMPPKINFWPRLSFGKKVLRPLFSPVFPSFPALEYIVYNPMLDFLWKTQWKKWKTLWENRLLFHKISGKPSGKS